MNDRQKLMRNIQVHDFACFEASLFLDTHPTDKEALAYFNKMNKLTKDLHAEYAEKYGPIHRSDSNSMERWTWVDSPWPWEYTSHSNG